MSLRCITLTQPWAGLVASGLKLVENRQRPIIPSSLHGQRIGIHASAVIDKSVYDRIYEIAPDLRHEARWHQLSRITGAVIGVGVMRHTLKGGWSETMIREHEESLRQQLAILTGDADQYRWFFGPVGHIFTPDMRALAMPVPCRGMLGCWTAPGDVENAVVAQLAEAA